MTGLFQKDEDYKRSSCKCVNHTYIKYAFIVTYKKERTGKFLGKLNTACVKKLWSLLKHEKENMPLMMYITMGCY
jgi:hypothetical protein